MNRKKQTKKQKRSGERKKKAALAEKRQKYSRKMLVELAFSQSGSQKERGKEKASYQCMECQHRYTSFPGVTSCPKCGSLYVKWVNYASDFSDLL